MKITVEWLKEKKACHESIQEFSEQYETDSIVILKKLIEQKRANWGNWLIVRLMTKRQCVQYAVFSAKQVIGIFEKKYPMNKAPRNVMEFAKEYLEKNIFIPRVPAAAFFATYVTAALAAADAASAAAASYADVAAAADASDADASEAAAAAADAAGAADVVFFNKNKKLMKIKILEYGIRLLNETS